jgi:DNA polymerase-4
MGEDERPVEDREVEKSISAEHTYSENQSDPKVLHQTLLELSEKVGRRLRAADLWACCVQIKIRSERFETFTRQRMLQQPIRRDLDILHTAHDLLLAFDPTWPVRLLGVGVSHLQESGPQPEAQLDLFAEPKCPESTRLDETVDQLRARYGRDALKRGHWSSPER